MNFTQVIYHRVRIAVFESLAMKNSKLSNFQIKNITKL